jgi:mannose-6-phosphate isomerase-like protein (cupin superfamily)
MGNYAVKRIDEMEAVFGGGFKRARAELGVESFGMQVLDMPAELGDRYPEHDHGQDGQEEVYVVLRGSGEIEIEGERHPLDAETMVRVGPGVKRKLFAGPQGVRVLALGGVTGKPYEAPDVSKLGEPDPMAQQS